MHHNRLDYIYNTSHHIECSNIHTPTNIHACTHPCIHLYILSLHTSINNITPSHIYKHTHTRTRYMKWYFIAWQHINIHWNILNCITWHYIAYITWHIALDYIHCVALNCICTLHVHTTLDYIALHHITLHYNYITFRTDINDIHPQQTYKPKYIHHSTATHIMLHTFILPYMHTHLQPYTIT